MATDVLDGEVVKPRLSHRAREEASFPLAATVLDLLLAPLYALGWVVFWVILIATETFRLSWAAVRIGWQDARESARTRRIAVDRWPARARVKRPSGGSG